MSGLNVTWMRIFTKDHVSYPLGVVFVIAMANL